MAVVAFREVSGRTLTHRFGEPPTAERKFVVTLDNTAHGVAEVLNAIGIFHGAAHPEYNFLSMAEATMTEGSPSPFHAEVTFSYELLQPDERDPNPLARPDIWSFATSGAAVPALYYFTGPSVLAKDPLVNSANDFFEGLQTEESECRAVITGNRAQFPLNLAILVTNSVNEDDYLGAKQHHWKCTGISGQQQIEMVNGAEVRYWTITTELVYRQTGWNLFLPNVGYNYLDEGLKKRAYVYDTDSGERVPCVNPVGLDVNGGLLLAGNTPIVLERRLNRHIPFADYFGTPSWL